MMRIRDMKVIKKENEKMTREGKSDNMRKNGEKINKESRPYPYPFYHCLPRAS